MENLEQIGKDWKQREKSNVVALKAYQGLAEVVMKDPCELLVAQPHFNLHNNVIVLIVPLMNNGSKPASETCCKAVKKVFKQDKLASLSVINVISSFVKGRNYEVRPEMLKIFLCLWIKDVEVKNDTEVNNKCKKFMNFNEKRKKNTITNAKKVEESRRETGVGTSGRPKLQRALRES